MKEVASLIAALNNTENIRSSQLLDDFGIKLDREPIDVTAREFDQG